MSTHESRPDTYEYGLIDDWGRRIATEPNRDHPPRHPAISLVYTNNSGEGFSIYHPDRLGHGEEAWLWTDDEELVMSVSSCR